MHGKSRKVSRKAEASIAFPPCARWSGDRGQCAQEMMFERLAARVITGAAQRAAETSVE